MKYKIIYSLLVTASFFITSCKNQDANSELPNKPTAADPGTTVKQYKVKVEPDILQPAPNAKQTEMVFTEEEFDFGTIKQGDKVNHIFTFKNTGKNDLIILKAMGSCGCTVPEFPKEPIAPGKTGVMKVSFNSKGKTGNQHKTISVYANVPKGGVTIAIKAKIKV
jgi:Protein of unknown function (DUF1573)